MELSKNKFVLLWICSAAVVTLVRILSTADPGYDLTLQIQAAQNLLAGHGVSIYSVIGEEDLTRPNRLVTLTYFSAGYSFFASALLAMGVGVGAVVKIGGTLGTMLGWWGWGNLAYAFFKEGFNRGRIWRWAGCGVCLASPLLFTPRWWGTDIFLWAAVPWVLGWVIRGSDEKALRGGWFDLLAGGVCGLCVLMRYSSVSLAAYTGFLILCQSAARPSVLVRRGGAFAVGLFPFLALQIYLNYFVSALEAKPAGIMLSPGVRSGFEHLCKGFWWLTSANFAVVWWMPRKVSQFFTQPGGQAPWLLGVTLVLFVLLPALFVRKLGCSGPIVASRDVRTAALGFFLALPLFLWACATVGGTVYMRLSRYYVPLLPLAVFVAYAFAVADPRHKSKAQGLLRITSLGYLLAYLCVAAVGVLFLGLPGENGSSRRTKLAGVSELHHWPSTRLIYEFSAARRYLLDLLKDEPGTVLVTNLEDWFYADASVDRSRLHSLLDLRASYINGPAHILIMAKEPFEAPVDSLYTWFTETGGLRPANYFQHLPNLHLLKRFPEEKIKILELRVPNGSRLTLNKQPVEKAE